MAYVVLRAILRNAVPDENVQLLGSTEIRICAESKSWQLIVLANLGHALFVIFMRSGYLTRN